MVKSNVGSERKNERGEKRREKCAPGEKLCPGSIRSCSSRLLSFSTKIVAVCPTVMGGNNDDLPRQKSTANVLVKTMSDSSDSGNSSSSGDESSSWFSQAKDWFELTMDQARIERLQQCRVLQETLAQCRKAAKKKQPDKRRLQLEHSPPGIRMTNYFKWRNRHEYDATCQREEHAVWACRAVALQCGSDLSQLRNCFNEVQGIDNYGELSNVGAVLKHKRTAYEIGKTTKSGTAASSEDGEEIPCRELQERMGECISENSKALARRHLERTSANEGSEEQ